MVALFERTSSFISFCLPLFSRAEKQLCEALQNPYQTRVKYMLTNLKTTSFPRKEDILSPWKTRRPHSDFRSTDSSYLESLSLHTPIVSPQSTWTEEHELATLSETGRRALA